ncbi:MAG: FAD-dependent oxidoreductase [Clostridia bacterium]|nr:FAD-dependent oxidoreductase [Clostridia bacterium]
MAYDKLFTPISIGKCEIKNRIVMAPMLMGMGQFDGTPTEKLMDYYEERAKGGTGLIITEITRVDDVTGAAAFAQLSMSKDKNIYAFRPFAERIHRHGAKLFVQLHHPGRQNLGLLVGTVPMSIALDSKLPFYSDLLYKIVPAGKVLLKHHIVPPVVAPSKCERSYFADSVMRALSNKEVKKLRDGFIEAGVRVQQAGADGVELHASHGYLIQQFLSPNTNHRTDEYGGSLENRMRFLIEILQGIKEKCGSDFPVIVRLTVDECYSFIGKPGKGYDLKEGVEMAKRLEQAGADAIDVSSAAYDTFNYWLEPMSFKCGWRAYMAAAVKAAVNIPVLAANLIRSPEQAEKQLEEGVQDMVSLGRPHIADPHWAEKAQSGHPEDITRCICCLYCIQSMQDNAYVGGSGGCSVNPFTGRESVKLEKNGNGRKVVVVGAGPAGLMSARLLAYRGFDVTLLEKEAKAGGQLILAAAAPEKEKMNWCIEDMVHQALKEGAEILYNTEATKELIASYNPYAVIFATGANAVRPGSVTGSDLPHVYTSTDILGGSVNLEGKNVAVIGSGMTGLETAQFLCENNKVTIIEMAKEIAPGTWMQHIDDIKPKLESNGVTFHTGLQLTEIRETSIAARDVKSGAGKTFEADAVVFAVGVRPEKALYEECKGAFENIFAIGDAEKSGRIADATRRALDTVLEIN